MKTNQEQREIKEREYWKKLKLLLEEKNFISYYTLYAEYLEWNNIISDSRTCLHKAAVKTAKYIESLEEEIRIAKWKRIKEEVKQSESFFSDFE